MGILKKPLYINMSFETFCDKIAELYGIDVGYIHLDNSWYAETYKKLNPIKQYVGGGSESIMCFGHEMLLEWFSESPTYQTYTELKGILDD